MTERTWIVFFICATIVILYLIEAVTQCIRAYIQRSGKNRRWKCTGIDSRVLLPLQPIRSESRKREIEPPPFTETATYDIFHGSSEQQEDINE
jgi:hypothetical protein